MARMIVRRTYARGRYGWVQFIPAIMEMMNPKAAPQIQMPQQSSNTGLYVAGGLAGLAVVGGLLYVAVKT
ncbi:MAG: hypothetical protein Q8R92_07810 [Deltaproteobacteria bacterium]|nr:hypothetical protein [Deltaproteobacteria bacterium]